MNSFVTPYRGDTEKGETKKLMFAHLTTISNEDCQPRWFEQEIVSGHLCTTSPRGIGTCFGDSGGPLAADGKLIGIVSFGEPCAIGVPDVFARVSQYKDWIEKTIEEN